VSVRISTRISLSSVLLLSCAVLTAGCSFSSGIQPIHQTAKGSIYFEDISDWSFDADHPTMIDRQTMLKVLTGLLVNDASPSSKPTNMPASGSKPMRVFSDEDAEFLAPLLAQGLSQAKPEQLVGFRVSSSAGSGAEPTAGTLYVQQGAVHLTLTSSKGLTKAIGFSPRSAARIEAASPAVTHGVQGVPSIVIEYPILAKIAGAAAAPVAKPDQPASQNTAGLTADEFLLNKMEELRRAKEAAALKDSEISMLRKENSWMKEKLREKSAQVNALKAGKAASTTTSTPKLKHKAELQPTR
jgi:hypothetical protein